MEYVRSDRARIVCAYAVRLGKGSLSYTGTGGILFYRNNSSYAERRGFVSNIV